MMAFEFDVGAVRVVTALHGPHAWVEPRPVRQWLFHMNGEPKAERRCGLPLAVETAWKLERDLWLHDSLPETEATEIDRLVRDAEVRIEAFIVEARRLLGDPDVSPLGPLVQSDATGVIYCIEAKDKFKIGFTRTGGLDQRLRKLQTGSPVKLRVAYAVPGSQAEERELHHRFRQWRTHGEWFAKRRDIERAFCHLVLDRGSART